MQSCMFADLGGSPVPKRNRSQHWINMCQILGPPGIAYRHWSYLRTGVASTFFYRGRVLLEYIYIYIYILYCLPYFDDLVKDDSDALQHYPHISVGWDWMANTHTFQSATFRMFQRGNRIFQRPLPLNPTDLLIHFFWYKVPKFDGYRFVSQHNCISLCIYILYNISEWINKSRCISAPATPII